MNPLSRHRQQQQKQKTLRMQKHENSLEFHSRLIEAAEVRFSTHTGQSYLSAAVFAADDWERRTSGAKALITAFEMWHG